MAKFTIYSKDGRNVRHVGEPQYSGSYMGVDFVEFRSVNSPTLIEWQIGDYVDYFRTGKRYKLYSFPMPNKVARVNSYGGSFEYSSVQFFAATKELEIAPFRDLVPEDNKIHFSTRPDVSTYENVYGIARRIQECINDIFPNRWRVEVFDTDDADLLSLLNETKEFSVSGGSCLDALSQIYETWKNVGWIHTYDSANDIDVITIGRANVRDTANTSDAFAYGKGNGLTSIRKAAANEGEFATRLYVYGSERNIQTRYYNGLDILNKDSVDIRNLMLPVEVWGITDGKPDARKAYLQADDSIIEKYGLIPRTVYFDGSENEEIYPSIKGLTMNRVRQSMIDEGLGDSEFLPTAHLHRIDKVEGVFSSELDGGSKEETEKNRTFTLRLYQLGFNIADQGKLTSEGYATISMKTGKCAGRDFKVRRYLDMYTDKVDGSRVLYYELEKAWDESLGMGYPNKDYPISEGDEFVLLDIPMPNFYIAIAEDDLLGAGRKMLADYTRVSAYYEPNINSIKIKDGGKPLYPGMFMQIQDNDVVDTDSHTDFVLIDTLTIDESAELPSYRVTLREQKRAARNYAALEDMIMDAKESAKESINKERRYSNRRFRDVQETIGLLQGALDNFSEGINPITVQTMALMLGDQSLQYKFTASRNSLTDIDCPIVYNAELKQMYCSPASLIHMTLGVESIVPADARTASDFKGWNLSEKYSETLEDGKARYVYVKASVSNEDDAYMVVSESAIAMNAESGYYHFLVGVLNSEYEGTRSFVTLYGYTEVLPGQITTDTIRSSDGKTVFDLSEGAISVGEKVGMSAKDDMLRIWAGATMENRKNAPFRVNEDGYLHAEGAYIEGEVYAEGGKLGDINILEGGLSLVNIPKEGYASTALINKDLIAFALYPNGLGTSFRSVSINLYDLFSSAIVALKDNSRGADAYAAIEAGCTGGDQAKQIAYKARSGMFAGLRPMVRTITANAQASELTLTEMDHTIIVISSSGKNLNLPETALIGQEIVIMMSNSGDTSVLHGIYSTEDCQIINPASGGASATSISVSATGVVKFVCAANGSGVKNWWYYRLA